MASLTRAALASEKVFPHLKGFICASWGVFNGVDGRGKGAVIRDPDVRELFDQLATSPFKGFVDPSSPGVMTGSNASLVVLDAQGKIVHVFNERPFEKEFRAAWEKLGQSPAQFPAKTEYTFPGVKETVVSAGPAGGPDRGETTQLVPNPGAAFRLFIDPGDSVKVVVEARTITSEQRKALSWSGEPRTIDAALFRNLFDTINPGGVARAADVILPWKEVTGSLAYRPGGPHGGFRTAVVSGPVRMTKKEGSFRAEGTFQMVVVYRPDSTEIHAIRGAMNATYVGGGNATADRPVQFKVALQTTPEPKEIPEAFRIPLGR